MAQDQPRTIERHCDVCVIGGSAAGLAAALQLGRQGRSVIVVDSGEPRNAPAAAMHGYLSREAVAPAELTAVGREEVRSYGGEVLAGRAVDVSDGGDRGFRVELTGGHSIVARRVLAATGLVDVLPEIEGFAEHWGRDVIHCPFCHGYEVRDRKLALIVTHPMGLHPAALFRQLTDRLTVVVHDPTGVDESELDVLRAGGVEVKHDQVRRIVADADGKLSAVELAAGGRIEADAVVVGPRFRARAEPFSSIGLRPTPHPSGLGDLLETNARGETAVPGIYAVGNVTDPSHQVLQAAADGSRVGAMISFSLADDDLRASARSSANQNDWDHRYEGRRLWSGNANGTLVNEVSGMTPGRALDVGAGEGGDAIWLAEQGWQVTANDISQHPLDRLSAEAQRHRLPIACHRADVSSSDPFGSSTFDLVSAQYASIPRSPDHRAMHNILAAVAPGGTLLKVDHDLGPIRGTIDTHVASRPFDPDAYLRVEDFAEALADFPDWTIEVYEQRPRPAGSASASHHVDDVVLRARRNEA